MGKQIEDLKETAPCGMQIRYTVDNMDFVSYNNINGRGKGKLTEKCYKCSWWEICKPTPKNTTYRQFKIKLDLLFAPEQMEILQASYERAKKQGFTKGIEDYVEHLAHIGACTTLLEIAKNI